MQEDENKIKICHLLLKGKGILHVLHTAEDEKILLIKNEILHLLLEAQKILPFVRRC